MKQLIPALFAVGAVMALIGAAVFITGWVYAPYIYTIGAGFVALAQVILRFGLKARRSADCVSSRSSVISTVLTGAFMFTTRGNEWLPALLSQPYWNYTRHSVFLQEEEKELSK